MSFPRYPSYKPSGVEWLGEVPEHWEALPLRRLIREVTSGTSVNAIDEPAGPGQAGVLKTSCVYTSEFRPEENKAILESELDRATCPVVAGSLIVSRMNTPDLVGAAGLVKNDDPSLFLPDRLWQVRFQVCDPQFMNYWCKSVSYRSQVQLACSGTSSSMQNLSQDNFHSFIAPLPPTGEQSAIATFLNRETAKIDALIAEQQRLIELLQEKRQAMISHAVTKGLNPDAPMKDSGVEWLGEVPEHWEVRRLKNLLTRPLQYGANEPADRDDPDLPRFVRITDIDEAGLLRDDTFRSLPHDIAEPYLLEDGDVLLARSGATVGKSFIYSREWGTACFAGYLVRARLREAVCRAGWLHYYCQTLSYWAFVGGSQIQATIQNVSAEKYANIWLPVPPPSEQVVIIDHLAGMTHELDTLTAAAKRAISLLQERRSALISAAVTGQIDVRGLAPEAEAA